MIINKKLKRAISVDELLKTNFKKMEFEGEWREAFGQPEPQGSWIVWGHSGNGKTRFALKLAKYLTQFGRVAYNTLEEGAKLSFQKAIKESGMQQVKSKFIILPGEGYNELVTRLKKQKSPDVIIIDSVQYFQISQKKYAELINLFPKKLFVFLSHAEGKNPKGTVADAIRYHSDVKIRVEGYKAFPVSRFGGGDPYTIWQEGAAEYWGTNTQNND